MPSNKPTVRKAQCVRRAKAGLVAVVLAAAALGATAALTQHSAGLRGSLTGNEILRQLRPAPLSGEDPGIDEVATGTTQAAPPRTRSPGLFGADAEEVFANPVEPRATSTSTTQEMRRERQGETETTDAQPTVEDITTGSVRTQPLEDMDLEALRRARPDNTRQGMIEELDRAADPMPFAPVGIRAGIFDLYPSLEQGIGWTSNAGNAPGGGASTFSETTLRLDAHADLARHEASLSGYGTYRKSIAGAPFDEFEGGIESRLRLDLTHDFDALAGFSYDVRPESAHAPDAVANAAHRPNQHILTGTAGLAKDAGHARLSATARVTRTMYDDARLLDDTIVSQRERNSTLATVTLRGGYAISPAITPFLETEFGRRFQDVRIDSDGFERSANRLALRGGLALNVSEKLSGEIAAGWLMENPDDAALSAISGLSVDGNLHWSPERGTTVTLSGTTTVEGTTAPGESGTLFYATGLTVARDLRADLTGSATLGADYRHYPGTGDHDVALRGEASLTWWLNRHAGIVGRFRHEEFRSSQPGRNSRETGVYMGVRAQR